jgi:DHA2 family methylenomycin A resistance protein-like MFS transporter
MNDRPLHAPPIGWTIAAASFGFVVVQLDVTIVNVALPRIAADLHASVQGLQWVVDAYALAFAVLLLSAGVLGDRLGAKRAYLIGFAVFALASAACGAAQDATQLIVARAVQGIGAALLVPPSLALLNHACAHDRHLRARAIGLWTAAGGVSIAAGPIVGGLLIASVGWRSIFFVNLPVCLIGVAMTLRLVETERNQGKHLDLRGQGLAILALVGLVTAVIEFGSLGIAHPLVLGCIATAFIAGAAFVAVEARVDYPMLPLRFFSLPNFSPAVLFGIAVNLTYYGVIFVLSLYLQHVRGYTAMQAGLAYLPLTATFIVSNVISGWATGRYGVRIPMIAGAAIGACGFALLARLDAHSGYLAMLPAFVLIPGGMGLAVPAMTTAILSSVEKNRAGTASAVLNAARQAAGAIGVAAFGALVGHGTASIVPGMHIAALASAGILIGATILAALGIRRDDIVTASGEQREQA